MSGKTDMQQTIDVLEDVLADMEHTSHCTTNTCSSNPDGDFCSCNLRGRKLAVAKRIVALKIERDKPREVANA